MNRSSILSFVIVVGGISALIATTAQSQIGPPKNYVSLQPTTPGTSQSGHGNISGTMRAGQFVGGGAGLTNLNASNISSGTLSTARLPIPLSLSGSPTSQVLSVENSSPTNFTRALYVHESGASGVTFGGEFEADSVSSIAVMATATSATGNTIGGRFDSNSPSGTGVLGLADQTGVEGQTYSLAGTGVFGFANSSTGVNKGVVGFTNSSAGYGVYGYSLNTTGTNFGVFGSIASINGRGVYGQATNATGLNYGGRFETDSDSGRGVFGIATAATGTTYGVRGQSNSPTGYGVFAAGDLGASGVKSFRIDDPSDPENKYILHYSAESPMPQNFYVGNAVTDGQGYAWVELPDYFAEINTNFKYQLTVVGKNFAQAIVSEEIVGNRFQVRTSAPNIKVSWRVDADRNDLYVREKQPKDVVEKVGLERGTYQHPELYSLAKERGMDCAPRVHPTAPKH